MIIFLISHQNYVVTTHLNHLIEAVQMRGHNICFYADDSNGGLQHIF